MQQEFMTRKRSLKSRKVKLSKSADRQEISNDLTKMTSKGGGDRSFSQYYDRKLRPLELQSYRVDSGKDVQTGWMATAHSASYSDGIGIAIGSPREIPLPQSPTKAENSQANDLPKKSSQVSYLTFENGRPPKGSRWKSLGGIIGRKSGWHLQSQAPAPYKTQTQPDLGNAQNRLYQHRNFPKSSRQRLTPLYSRAESQSRSGVTDMSRPIDIQSPQRKLSLKRSHFSRKLGKDSAIGQKSKKSVRAGAHDKVSNSQKQDMGVNELHNCQGQGGPLLQVDIPNIQMERYSIMFSSLLQPTRQSTPSPQPFYNRESSLLARRHAQTKELGTRPSLSPKPSSTYSQSSPRSTCEVIATSQAKLPSFSLFPPSSPSIGRKPSKPHIDRSSLHRAATGSGGDFLGHTGDESSSGRPRSHRPPRLDLASQMTFSTTRGPPSPSMDSLPAIETDKQGLQSSVEHEGHLDDPLRQATEVSIARQISISQRQRQLLTSVVPRIARQPMQPTVVDVQPSSTSRKSHHLVLEDA